ncbi:MAG: FG-GAP-like repeat-containing protein, partial [Cyclobacteriaceae bacterium]
MFKIPYFLLVFSLFAFSVSAQITSTFDTDADGWTCSDNNHSAPLTVNYNSTGGNPGGYISAGTTSSQPYFFTSPSKFGGNIQYFCYGQELTFDMQLNYTPTTHGAVGDVQISVQSGSKIVLNLPSFPAQAPAWSTHTIRLDETAGWRLGGTTGPLATKVDMMQHLSGVLGAYAFRFNIDYTDGTVNTFSGAIDNVVLNQRTILPSPSISSISLTSGNPGTSVTISGNNFDPSAANNAVYFGGVAGTITSASATSLTVTVPPGAQYGQITVINKTTGLSKLSEQPFTPTFSDGGRIIPASFAPKFDITITGGYGGLSLADMDGDGWNDLVVASEDNSGIGVYRNLGLGGDLTASSFAARVDFLTGVSGTNGAGLSTTDLDGDGKLDMATSGWVGGPGGGVFVTFRNT